MPSCWLRRLDAPLTYSVHLRTVSILSARPLSGRLSRIFVVILGLYCDVTSYKPRQGDRTVAVFELKIVSLLVPTVFLEYLRRLNDSNIRMKVTVEDVLRRLARARSVFKIRAGDSPVKTAFFLFIS